MTFSSSIDLKIIGMTTARLINQFFEILVKNHISKRSSQKWILLVAENETDVNIFKSL